MDPSATIYNSATYEQTQIQEERGWSTRDVFLAVACGVSAIAIVTFMALALSPVGAAPLFLAFYKVFSIWAQLSCIALCLAVLTTVVHRNCTEFPHLQNAIRHLVI